MTEFLYDEKPYDVEFDATVISCEAKGDAFEIVLDSTLFFPEQGGQTCDTGYIEGSLVSDVQLSEGIVYHTCSMAFAPGEKVHGKIDWQHRFNNMQQHTGEHIFTGLAHSRYGAQNVGFHLSDNTVTLDLDIELNSAQIREIEVLANEVIAENRRVKCYYPDLEQLKDIDYRSKKEIEGPVRLVEIEGVDICACCAPHATSTAQVGLLKVISFEKYKGGVRVYILCGSRAFFDYSFKQSIIDNARQVLNCKPEEIEEKIKSLLNENKNTKYEMSQIKTRQLLAQIEAYPAELSDITIFTEGVDSKIMREGVNGLMEKHDGLCSIFSGNDEDGYSFVIGSRTRDCQAIMSGLRQMLLAKGGGNKQMAQGSVASTKSEIERVM